MYHHHNSRHNHAHLDPTASQKLAHVGEPVSVCTRADTHSEKEVTGGNERSSMGYHGRKTQNHDGAPQFTQLSEDFASVTEGIEKLPIPSKSRSVRTAGAPPTSPTQLTVPNPQSSTYNSYEDTATEEEDSVVIVRIRGQMRGRSRTRMASCSTGGPAFNTYGQQPRNSSNGFETTARDN